MLLVYYIHVRAAPYPPYHHPYHPPFPSPLHSIYCNSGLWFFSVLRYFQSFVNYIICLLSTDFGMKY